jgi:hypothetical protein
MIPHYQYHNSREVTDMGKRAFMVSLLVLFCLACLARWGYRSQLAYPRFVAEGAAHFRYTRMVSEGRPIPALDLDAQHPEGLRVFRETTPGMEYLFGYLHRMLPRTDLGAFIRFFSAFFFSLAVFPFALLAARLWGSRRAGLLSAALFAVALPLVARSSGFDFIRENVTFPLIVYHIHFLAASCQRRSVRESALSALFLFAAMATWQGTQFYLIPLLVLLLARRVFVRTGDGERLAVRLVSLAVIAAGASLPFLREGHFLLSLPAGLAYAWLACDAADFLTGGKRALGTAVRIAVVAAVAAALIIPGVLEGHFTTYSHFFRLLAYKLRYAHKPSDPTLLPFDVRAFWVGPFHSPDPRNIFVFALPLLILVPGQLQRLVRRAREGDFPALFVTVFLAISLVLYFMMQRLLPFFGIFAALAAGGNAVPAAEGGARRWRGSEIATVCVLGISLLQVFAWEGPVDIWRGASRLLRVPYRERFVIFPMQGDVDGALLSWIERNTPERSVIMTTHYLSPQLLTYTGRPTNLNDFFESPRLRKKAETFLTLLYSSEERLYSFCMEQESDYLLVSITAGCDPTGDSPLYQAGLTDMPPGCAVYRLLFDPDRSARFELVYENEMYRLFRVGRSGAERRWPRSPLFYDEELLWLNEGDIRSFYYSIMRIYSLTSRGLELARQGRGAEAERILSDVMRTYYFYPAWRALMNIRSRDGGRPSDLEPLAGLAYRADPYRADVCLELAGVRIAAGKIEEAAPLLEQCASLSMTESEKRRLERLEGRVNQKR